MTRRTARPAETQLREPAPPATGHWASVLHSGPWPQLWVTVTAEEIMQQPGMAVQRMYVGVACIVGPPSSHADNPMAYLVSGTVSFRLASTACSIHDWLHHSQRSGLH